MISVSEKSKSMADGIVKKTPLILALYDDINTMGYPAGTCGIPNMKAGDVLGEGTVMAVADTDSGMITNYVLFKSTRNPDLENRVLIDLKKADLNTETGEYTDAEGNVYAELSEEGAVLFDSDVFDFITSETGLISAEIYIDGKKTTTGYAPTDDEFNLMSVVNSNFFMLAGELDGLYGAVMYDGGKFGAYAMRFEDGTPAPCTADHDLKFVFTARDAKWLEWKGSDGK